MDKSSQLEQIARNIKICQKCRLYKTAKCGVPGEGDVDTEIALIGEAPGATEDATGRPFVGRAGKLLEAMIQEI
jgi:uracil-DNA glycosylase family 4